MSESKDMEARSVHGPLTIATLVGYQNAEFQRASDLRTWLILFQFAVAVSGALSVVVNDGVALYLLAIAGFILLLIWLVLDARYRAHRLAGERARRATLVMYGLGTRISPEEVFDLRNGFEVTPEAARSHENRDYFATKAEPGARRLLEMLEESAFWSETLQRTSAKAMRIFFGTVVAIGIVAVFVALPFTDTSTVMLCVRAFLAILVFALSSDVLMATRSHDAAAVTIGDIRKRLQTAAKNGYGTADVVYLMSEYNAAVEAAPVVVPLAYKLKRDGLNKQWTAYVAERSVQDAVGTNAAISGRSVA